MLAFSRQVPEDLLQHRHRASSPGLMDIGSPSSEEVSDSNMSRESDYSDPEHHMLPLHEEDDFSMYGSAVSQQRAKKRPSPAAQKTKINNNNTNVVASKKKNKTCEFCGTSDTPMWRRGPQGKGTLCNACGVKWSLKYRKQKTTKESGNSRSSKKTPKRNPDSPILEEDDYMPNRDMKRRRAEYDDENSSDSTSDHDEVEKSGNKLFGSLLNVVENKLVEAQELEEIKNELKNWREVVDMREMRRQKNIEETQARIMGEMSEFKRQFMRTLASNESSVNSRIDRLERDVASVAYRTNSIQQELAEMKALLQRELVGVFSAKIENLESQMSDLRYKVQNNCADVKSQVSSGMNQLKNNFAQDLYLSEQSVAAELEQLRYLTDVATVKRQMERMEQILPSSEQNSTH